jgi:DNA-binding MarR family transcriptional regulator
MITMPTNVAPAGPGSDAVGPGSGAVSAGGSGTSAGAECEELAGALERLVSMWRRLAVPGELSSTAAFTLARLSRDGPCRLTDLAAHENVSQPAMTQLVSRLESQGLAERCSEPGDARVVNVAVTARGEELIARRRAARAARFAEFFAMLPAHHQAALASALPALQLLAETAASPPGSQPPP